MTRPRVLLVDDEVQVVASSRRALARLAPDLDVVVAGNGIEALDVLAQAPCAVIVTDLRMPRMTGVELLEVAARVAPSTARIMLSGTAEAEAAMEAMVVAHRFLCKPCNNQRLAEACREILRHAASGVDIGPVLVLAADAPAVARVRAGMAYDRSTLTRAILAHPAIAATVLHAVGSEFLGERTVTATIDDALTYLGHAGLERLLDSDVLLVVDGDDATPIADLATASRLRADRIVENGGTAIDELAGLLVDVDRFGSADPNDWSGLRPGGGDTALLGLWGLTNELVERVAQLRT